VTASTAASPSLLRHPPFVLHFTGRMSSSIATRVLAVAVGWQVYALTRSALLLGLVALVQYLPTVGLTLVAGHAADRFDRRRIAFAARLVKGVVAAALVVAQATHGLAVGEIFAAVAVFGAAAAFESPAVDAMLTAVAPGELLPRASAISSASMQLAEICGPPVGGVLYAIAPTLAYAMIALFYLAASAAAAAIPLSAPPNAKRSADWRDVFEGLAFIRRNPEILGVISLDLFAVLFGGATALLPIYAADILRTGPWGLGLLRAGPAVGALAMSGFLTRAPLARAIGLRMFQAVIAFGAATVAFALSTNVFFSLAALALMGGADAISVVIRSVFVQLRTPDALRGRVGAVNFLFINSSNLLGEFESGVTAALIGAVPAAALGGVLTVLVALIWMRLFPTLKDVDTFA